MNWYNMSARDMEVEKVEIKRIPSKRENTYTGNREGRMETEAPTYTATTVTPLYERSEHQQPLPVLRGAGYLLDLTAVLTFFSKLVFLPSPPPLVYPLSK